MTRSRPTRWRSAALAVAAVVAIVFPAGTAQGVTVPARSTPAARAPAAGNAPGNAVLLAGNASGTSAEQAGNAPGTPVPAAENRVGASRPGMIFTVGADQPVSAVQGRGEGVPRPLFVSGACVAAEDSSNLADAATCGGMSFSAGTKVLLASGAAIPISQLKTGDKVLATNVRTGKTSAEPVTAVLVHHDTDRFDLTVKTAHGSAVIQTTTSHLFWDATVGRWVEASALGYGSRLSTGGGANVTVLGGYVPADAAGWMWDLTVTSDHDFYVDTTIATVLVHNCPVGQPFNEDQDAVVQLAKEAKQLGGLTADEGQALRELAEEEGLPYHPDIDEPYETHPGRGFGSQPHIHIGPINHIPILP